MNFFLKATNFFLNNGKVVFMKNRKNVTTMKRGNVRIPLNGKISDYNDTMILNKSDLEQTKDQQQVRTSFFFFKKTIRQLE